jgi:hypothetical protein
MSEKLVDALLNFADAMENAALVLKQAIGEKAEATNDYHNMLTDLKAHNGKLTRDGLFYWLFQDGATVGRKKRKY